jgi:hypothetical protein
MRYELWGLHPANLIDTFESEAEALAEVRGLLAAGWQADDLSLGRVEGTNGSLVAEGSALARLAGLVDEGRTSLSA